jgi:uncharacterized membrane protein YgcG
MTKAAYLLLDRSGSMASCQKLITGGINDFLSRMQNDATGRDAKFIMTTFDSQGFDIVRRGDIADVKPLADGEFAPRALTPLYDAVGHAISDLDQAEAQKRMLIIVTDGEENASKKFTAETIKSLITERQKSGWIVIYLAAHVDAWKQAEAVGVPKEMAMNFKAAPVAVPRTGLLGALGMKAQTNPFAIALGAAAGVGLVYAMGGAAQAHGFSEQNRNDAMGVDGINETWQDAVEADISGFDEPFAGVFDLPPDVAAAEAGQPADFDPSQGSVNADGEQTGQPEGDVYDSADLETPSAEEASESDATSSGGGWFSGGNSSGDSSSSSSDDSSSSSSDSGGSSGGDGGGGD